MARMRIEGGLAARPPATRAARPGPRFGAEIACSSRGDTRVRTAVHFGYARSFRITYTCGRPCTRNRSAIRFQSTPGRTKEQLGRHTAVDMHLVVAHSSGLDADPHRREYAGYRRRCEDERRRSVASRSAPRCRQSSSGPRPRVALHSGWSCRSGASGPCGPRLRSAQSHASPRYRSIRRRSGAVPITESPSQRLRARHDARPGPSTRSSV